MGNGVQNIFTAEYNAQGGLRWAQATQGDYVDQSSGIAVDADGNAYITGYFQSDSINFGSNVLYNPTGGQVTFLAQYNQMGKARWAVTPDGKSNNTGAAVCYNAGSAFITGGFQNTDIIFGNDTLLPQQQQVFIAKLDTGVVTTGINTVTNALAGIRIYPNPSTGDFCFKGVIPGSDIEVFDLAGQSAYHGHAEAGLYTINLNGMAKGMYVYNINLNGAPEQQGKILLQ